MRCDGMTSTTKEFREFLLKQNAFALAIGVIIGAAIGKVVSGIVEDVLMPVIGLVLPGGEWRAAQLTLSGQNAIKYGDLAGRVSRFPTGFDATLARRSSEEWHTSEKRRASVSPQ